VLADQLDCDPAGDMSCGTRLVNASLVVRAPGNDDVCKLLCWHTEFLEGGLDEVDILMKNLVIKVSIFFVM
jgi:hypothetical protein